MRVGIACGQVGRLGRPAAVKALAEAAESVGYSTVWVLDRLLSPLEPSEGYAGVPGLPIPPEQQRALDPLMTLAAVAAQTNRVRIGTSVLVAPWYPPALLARSLTSLDLLSDGRLSVGLGTGWSSDEYRAAGADFARRGRALDETLDVLEAYWSRSPVVSHRGDRSRIAPSRNLLLPVQRPRPPLLLAAYTPPALERVARRADGWIPAGLQVDQLEASWALIRATAAAAGRDPDTMEMVVRANIYVTGDPVRGDRPSYTGSFDQVVGDVRATRDAGANEILPHLHGDPTLDEALDIYAEITEAVGLPTAA